MEDSVGIISEYGLRESSILCSAARVWGTVGNLVFEGRASSATNSALIGRVEC